MNKRIKGEGEETFEKREKEKDDLHRTLERVESTGHVFGNVMVLVLGACYLIAMILDWFEWFKTPF